VTFVDNAGVSLALEVRGHGPETLLFAHGWISSRRMWYDVVERLDPERYTMALLDFRGAGLSDRPPGGHDLEGYASDLRAVLATFEQPVTIVAHSAGGKIAQYVATGRPANLAGLVLLAPGTASGIPANPRHRVLTERAFGYRRRIEAFQRGAMARDISPEALGRIVDDALVVQREAWFGWYDDGRPAQFTDRIGAVAVPTSVLAGEADPLTPVSRLRREVVEAIPGATLTLLAGVGHNIPVEAPARVVDALARLP
jgi:pimeloyl-ACP methyl ester carboxylesterase